MILWLLLLLSMVWFAVFRYKRRNMYKLAALTPTVKNSVPIFGSALSLTGDTEAIMSALQTISYESMENDGLVKGWLGHILYYVIVNPVDTEMLVKTCLEKDDLHRFMRKVIGYGGIFAPVSIWRQRRKVLVPVFSPKIIENFVDVFSAQSEKLAEKLSYYTGIGKFSIWPHLNTYTLDSVCETTMGIQINAQSNPNSPFLLAMNRILNLVCERIFHLWLQPDWLFKLFPQYKEHQKCVSTMHKFTDEVIKEKRNNINNEKERKTEADKDYDLGVYKNQTFLDLLISLSGGKQGYTDLELREELLTLAVAGTDTSAIAVGYTMKLLGKYPEIQEKVYEEIYEVFGDSDRPLVKKDLLRLKYLERVVKESLRLFPPVPFIIRKNLKDTTLPSGRVLSGGSGVVVSIWGAHRDPKYWGPDAESFDPDRFLPERFNLAHACSYMPFSNGPRNCVGYQYAIMSVKTALSAIIRRYRIIEDIETSPVPRIKVKLDIMMKATDGYQLALENRKPEKKEIKK